MMKQARRLVLLCVGAAFLLGPCPSEARSKTKSKAKPKAKAVKVVSSKTPTMSWQSLARKVGQSEENRDQAIRAIKKIPHLQLELYRALPTSDRPLALEVIGALKMRALLPDLMSRMTSDDDGFTVLAVTSLMNEKNSGQILRMYADSLAPSRLNSVSVPVAVAMLEPLARLNVKLPRATLLKLSVASSPDIRASLLSYLRVMALRNDVLENLDLVTEMTRASEVQLRLQAISVSAEIASKPRMFQLSSVKSLGELNDLCLREAGSTLKEACLSFLSIGVAVKP